MPDFSHLHCHTQYSLLDGAARIKTLVTRAAEMELTALAITDHGNLFGVPEFYTAASKLGVQPIIGCEFYITPSGLHDRQDRTRYHQVLLARNEEGYRNLIRLSSLSYTEGYYYKPRIDRAALRAHREGLIATTCCLQGEVLQTILSRGEAAARKVFEAYLDLFGEDYYIEIQDHGIAEQKKCNAVLLRWAREYGVKVIASNDVHYVEREDAAAQDVLLCLQTGKDLHDPTRMRFENDQFYLKSAQEMQAALPDLPPAVRDEALANTREVADKCRFELAMGDLLMPHYPIPEAYAGDMDAYLRHLVLEGARRRYQPVPQEVVDRLNHELGIIKEMGYAGYFLIVQDFTTAARRLGVSVGPGRGSAAGSAVAYCLGITNIDPLAYELLFERFLNPERISMPDIDIDFDDRGRAKVIDYVVKKYGRESVCQIITFGTMGARSVIRDVARVLGLPLSEADRIAKLIPEGPKVTLDTALEEVPALRQLVQDPDPQIRKLMHYAKVLEGSARHTGVHAAGVIIAPGRVSDYVPVSVAKSKGDDIVTTQYDGRWVESFGLLKMDFLGLKTLTILKDTLDLIQEHHGVEVDLDAIPLDDPKTFALFQRGETVAIFQFESSGMREWMRKLKPTCIDDLIAMNALYRPGPMDLIPNYIDRKHGREKVEYPHPMLKDILEPTYGIPVYQEQVMQMAQVMAGYTLGGADLLRRAMGKKKWEEMDKQRAVFVQGAGERGVPAEKANEVFDMMAKFAGYGFNKCLVGETEVVDAATGRLVKIEEVYRRGMHLRETVTCNTARLRLQAGRVAAVMDNGVKPVYRLTTSSGRQIEATANHPFYTFDGWRRLDGLQAGDRIATPRTLPVEGRATWPEHEVIALGHLMAEGHLCHPHSVYFYTQDDEQLADYVRAAEAFDNVQCTVALHRGTYAVYARRRDRRRPPGIATWARQLGIWGRNARQKALPAEAFELNNRQIALLISRMWEGDGHINVQGRSLFYATASERLARQLQHLLLRLGIVSRLRSVTFPYKDGRTGYQLFITGNDPMAAFNRHVGIHFVSAASMAKLAALHLSDPGSCGTLDTVPVAVKTLVRAAKARQSITWADVEAGCGVSSRDFYPTGTNPGKRGFTRRTLSRLAAYFDDPALRLYAESDIYWDEVVRIEYVGDKQTYDLEIPGTHNFVANDIIVHNSHSAAYSIVAYQTAYLKAHYPAAFMAAAMTNEMGDTKKLAVVLEEARSLGLEMLPPCVNHSQAHFTVEDGRIRFGLGAVKGVGLGAIESIVSARAQHGPFTSLFGMAKELDLRAVNKKALEALARVGALDSLEGHRAQLLEALDVAVQYAQKTQADRAAGQNSLFGGGQGGPRLMEPHLPIVDPWPRSRMLKEERDLIGFYVSGHPLEAFLAEARAFATAELGDIETLEAHSPTPDQNGYSRERGPVHRFCGIITEVQRRTTKTDKPILFATLEDFTGQGELVCFSTQLDRVQPYLKVDEIVLVKGAAEVRGGSVKVVVQDVVPMWKVREQLVRAVVLRINTERARVEQIEELRALCDANRGRCMLYFDIEDEALPSGRQRIRSRKYVVDPTPQLMQGITRLFGRENVLLEGEA